MLTVVMKEAKQQKNIFVMAGLFVFFLGLYIFLDFEGNTNYDNMVQLFGLGITLLHFIINVIIALLTSIMVSFSLINYRLTQKEPAGSNAIPFLTFIFGLLTFGCTGCVVAFLGAVGIGFTPLILPNGNLIWKLVALGIVVVGFIWIMYSIQHTRCKIQK